MVNNWLTYKKYILILLNYRKVISFLSKKQISRRIHSVGFFVSILIFYSEVKKTRQIQYYHTLYLGLQTFGKNATKIT